MPRKPPKVRMMKPRIPTADFRTCKPLPRTFANRLKADPLLGFYQSPEWRQLRAAVIQERGPTCEQCGTVSSRPIVDHKTEIRDGGARLERSNLVVVCASCHGMKTYRARAERLGLA